MGMSEFAQAMVTLCLANRGSVTSWIRSPARNAQVGGVPTSYHLVGLGADVVLDSMDADSKQHFTLMAERMGIRVIDEGHHLHCQPV